MAGWDFKLWPIENVTRWKTAPIRDKIPRRTKCLFKLKGAASYLFRPITGAIAGRNDD